MEEHKIKAQQWAKELENKTLDQVFEFVLNQFEPDKIVVASSLSMEDQVITHAYLQHNPLARVFILDTGRHYPETYTTLQASMDFFNMKYEVYAPSSDALEKMVSQYGPNSFYQTVELRKLCCHIRKVLPLQRVLSTAHLWVTGIRQEHSKNREQAPLIEWDETNGLFKLNPLVYFTLEQVEAYVKTHQLPINPLHSEGFPSIGCQPCTRKVLEGEEARRGRWWWEDTSHNECGLHRGKNHS